MASKSTQKLNSFQQALNTYVSTPIKTNRPPAENEEYYQPSVSGGISPNSGRVSSANTAGGIVSNEPKKEERVKLGDKLRNFINKDRTSQFTDFRDSLKGSPTARGDRITDEAFLSIGGSLVPTVEEGRIKDQLNADLTSYDISSPEASMNTIQEIRKKPQVFTGAAAGAIDATEDILTSPYALTSGAYSASYAARDNRLRDAKIRLAEIAEQEKNGTYVPRTYVAADGSEVAMTAAGEKAMLRKEIESLEGGSLDVSRTREKAEAAGQKFLEKKASTHEKMGFAGEFADATRNLMAEQEGATRFISNLAYSGGRMLPDIAIGQAAGAIAGKVATGAVRLSAASENAALKGLLYQAAPVYGAAVGSNVASVTGLVGGMFPAVYSSSLNEQLNSDAYKNGEISIAQANGKALADASLEVLTEAVVGGVPGLNEKGVLDVLVDRIAEINPANAKGIALGAYQLGHFLTQNKVGKLLYDFFGESIEEAASEIAQPFFTRMTVDPNAPNATPVEVGLAALSGGLTAFGFQLGNVCSLTVSRGGKINANKETGNVEFTDETGKKVGEIPLEPKKKTTRKSKKATVEAETSAEAEDDIFAPKEKATEEKKTTKKKGKKAAAEAETTAETSAEDDIFAPKEKATEEKKATKKKGKSVVEETATEEVSPEEDARLAREASPEASAEAMMDTADSLPQEQRNVYLTFCLINKYAADGIITDDEVRLLSEYTGLPEDRFTGNSGGYRFMSRTNPLVYRPSSTMQDAIDYVDNEIASSVDAFYDYLDSKEQHEDFDWYDKLGTYVEYGPDGSASVVDFPEYLRTRLETDSDLIEAISPEVARKFIDRDTSVQDVLLDLDDGEVQELWKDFVAERDRVTEQNIKTTQKFIEPLKKSLDRYGIKLKWVDNNTISKRLGGEVGAGKYDPSTGTIYINKQLVQTGAAARIVISAEVVRAAQTTGQANALHTYVASAMQKMGLSYEDALNNLPEYYKSLTPEEQNLAVDSRFISHILSSDVDNIFKVLGETVEETVEEDDIFAPKKAETTKKEKASKKTTKKKAKVAEAKATETQADESDDIFAPKQETQTNDAADDIFAPKAEAEVETEEDIFASKEEPKKSNLTEAAEADPKFVEGVAKFAETEADNMPDGVLKMTVQKVAADAKSAINGTLDEKQAAQDASIGKMPVPDAVMKAAKRKIEAEGLDIDIDEAVKDYNFVRSLMGTRSVDSNSPRSLLDTDADLEEWLYPTKTDVVARDYMGRPLESWQENASRERVSNLDYAAYKYLDRVNPGAYLSPREGLDYLRTLTNKTESKNSGRMDNLAKALTGDDVVEIDFPRIPKFDNEGNIVFNKDGTPKTEKFTAGRDRDQVKLRVQAVTDVNTGKIRSGFVAYIPGKSLTGNDRYGNVTKSGKMLRRLGFKPVSIYVPGVDKNRRTVWVRENKYGFDKSLWEAAKADDYRAFEVTPDYIENTENIDRIVREDTEKYPFKPKLVDKHGHDMASWGVRIAVVPGVNGTEIVAFLPRKEDVPDTTAFKTNEKTGAIEETNLKPNNIGPALLHAGFKHDRGLGTRSAFYHMPLGADATGHSETWVSFGGPDLTESQLLARNLSNLSEIFAKKEMPVSIRNKRDGYITTGKLDANGRLYYEDGTPAEPGVTEYSVGDDGVFKAYSPARSVYEDLDNNIAEGLYSAFEGTAKHEHKNEILIVYDKSAVGEDNEVAVGLDALEDYADPFDNPFEDIERIVDVRTGKNIYTKENGLDKALFDKRLNQAAKRFESANEARKGASYEAENEMAEEDKAESEKLLADEESAFERASEEERLRMASSDINNPTSNKVTGEAADVFRAVGEELGAKDPYAEIRMEGREHLTERGVQAGRLRSTIDFPDYLRNLLETDTVLANEMTDKVVKQFMNGEITAEEALSGLDKNIVDALFRDYNVERYTPAGGEVIAYNRYDVDGRRLTRQEYEALKNTIGGKNIDDEFRILYSHLDDSGAPVLSNGLFGEGYYLANSSNGMPPGTMKGYYINSLNPIYLTTDARRTMLLEADVDTFLEAANKVVAGMVPEADAEAPNQTVRYGFANKLPSGVETALRSGNISMGEAIIQLANNVTQYTKPEKGPTVKKKTNVDYFDFAGRLARELGYDGVVDNTGVMVFYDEQLVEAPEEPAYKNLPTYEISEQDNDVMFGLSNPRAMDDGAGELVASESQLGPRSTDTKETIRTRKSNDVRNLRKALDSATRSRNGAIYQLEKARRNAVAKHGSIVDSEYARSRTRSDSENDYYAPGLEPVEDTLSTLASVDSAEKLKDNAYVRELVERAKRDINAWTPAVEEATNNLIKANEEYDSALEEYNKRVESNIDSAFGEVEKAYAKWKSASDAVKEARAELDEANDALKESADEELDVTPVTKAYEKLAKRRDAEKKAKAALDKANENLDMWREYAQPGSVGAESTSSGTLEVNDEAVNAMRRSVGAEDSQNAERKSSGLRRAVDDVLKILKQNENTRLDYYTNFARKNALDGVGRRVAENRIRSNPEYFLTDVVVDPAVQDSVAWQKFLDGRMRTDEGIRMFSENIKGVREGADGRPVLVDIKTKPAQIANMIRSSLGKYGDTLYNVSKQDGGNFGSKSSDIDYDALLNEFRSSPSNMAADAEDSGRNSARDASASLNTKISNMAKRRAKEPTPEAISRRVQELIRVGAMSNPVLANNRTLAMANERLAKYSDLGEALSNWLIDFDKGIKIQDKNGKVVKDSLTNEIVYGDLLQKELTETIQAAQGQGENVSSMVDLLLEVASRVDDLKSLAGSATQSSKILMYTNRKSPNNWLKREVRKLGEQYGIDIELDAEDWAAYENAKTPEEIEAAMGDIATRVAEMIPTSATKALQAWRYTCMLLNIPTHGANIVSNTANFVVKSVMTSAVAGAMEGTVMKGYNSLREKKGLSKEYRTRSLGANIKPPKGTAARAEWDASTEFIQTLWDNPDVRERIQTTGMKYATSADAAKATAFRRMVNEKFNPFGDTKLGRGINWASSMNYKGLEGADMIALKQNFPVYMRHVMAANGFTAEYLQSGTKEAVKDFNFCLEKAIKDSQDATYRSYNLLSDILTSVETKLRNSKIPGSNVAAELVNGLTPFKTVPGNFLKQAVDYVPVPLGPLPISAGVLIGAVEAASIMVNTMRGVESNVSMTKAIDHMASGSIGTAFALLGYLLGHLGYLRASGDDNDRAERYGQSLGSQNYAIVLRDGSTISIDRLLPPISVALFGGVEAANYIDKMNATGETAIDVNTAIKGIKEATKRMTDPIVEMTFLQGWQNFFDSLSREGLGGGIASLPGNYLGQMVPTAFGRIETLFDPTVRSTQPDQNSAFAGTERQLRKIANKIPGVSSLVNDPVIDLWGEEKRSWDTLGEGLLELVAPAYYQSGKKTREDEVLLDLYNRTGDSSVLPKAPSKSYKINYVDYFTDNKTYNLMSETVGKVSRRGVDEAVGSNLFATLSPEAQATVVSNIYKFANSVGKYDDAYARGVADKSDEEQIQKVQNALSMGLSIGEYFIIKWVMDNAFDSDKNAKGNPIPGSVKKKQIAYGYSIGLNNAQLALFGIEP